MYFAKFREKLVTKFREILVTKFRINFVFREIQKKDFRIHPSFSVHRRRHRNHVLKPQTGEDARVP